MGKGNRNKKQRAQGVLAAPVGKGSAVKKQRPTWVGTVIVVTVLAILIVFAGACILNARGVFVRNKVVASTEHFEITVPMMSYLVYSECENFVSTYTEYGYLQYFRGEGGTALNTSIGLRDQNYSVVTDKTTGVTTTTTWFDYFASSAGTAARQILILCEEAYHFGITLDESDHEQIESSLQMMELYASISGYTTTAYISNMYGQGVSLNDVRDIMELSQLANKFAAIRQEELKAGATDGRVNAYYEAHKNQFNGSINYISYTFSTSFKPADASAEDAATKNSEAYATYEAEQTKYQERVDALKECKSAAEFSNLLMSYLEADATAAGDENPTLTALTKVSDNTHLNYEKPSSSTDVSSWLFSTDPARAKNDTKTFVSTKDGYDEEKTEYSAAESTYTVAFVTEPLHKNETLVRNVGHILFKTDTFKGLTNTDKLSGKTKELAQRLLDKGKTISAEAMANELIAMLLEEGKITEKVGSLGKYYVIDKDVFKEYGETYTEDANVFYEEVKTGDMVAEFEDWLFDTIRVEGEISYPSAIKTDYGYHIMYYAGEGDTAQWVYDVKDALVSADYDAWYEVVSNKHVINVNNHSWDYIDG
ncbi:MAG: hypothetical protein E7663_06875 [Ruminococcaceae bacterium]|nr:hypothetical protein [Oscillospiraceae bacterium]